MREKILSLAKGNFAYDMPELVRSVEQLSFQVAAGTRKTESFTVTNTRGTRVKGFGTVEEACIEFLPLFGGEKNELTLEVHAEELVPGEHLRGDLILVTDCGECRLPYDIEIVAPELSDQWGTVKDYYAWQEQIKEDPERGAELFLSPAFCDAFLYRDEGGRILYDHLIRKNTKRQAMEEFLVATGKKKPIRFEAEHVSGHEITYELNGTDIQDRILIRVNVWGHTGIQVRSTVDFIEPRTNVMYTDEFDRKQDVLEFVILADKVPAGRRYGELILQSPYEKKVFHICAHNQNGEQERRIRRARKKAIAMLCRTYLAYQEDRITSEVYRNFLRKNREVLEKISGAYATALRGYIAIMLREKEEILDFFRETEPWKLPVLGVPVVEVESYIMIQFVKTLYTDREEERQSLAQLIHTYVENGYQSAVLMYILVQVDKRYHSLHFLEQDVRGQIEAGANSPLLYSLLVQAYREDTTLITGLDPVTIQTVMYGLKHDLTTEEINLAVSFFGERMRTYDGRVFAVLQRLYDIYGMPDTLRGICGMLIRSELPLPQYFYWFAKGVDCHLRLTDLFEYYMYTLDTEKADVLPDVVLSYFQYENHLNDRCKAFLFAYIMRHRKEQPDVYAAYEEQITRFARRQLAHHRISEHIAVLYEGLWDQEDVTGEIAAALPYVMFTYSLVCDYEGMDGVIVIHKETKEETYYPLENGRAQINLYTPNEQLFFLDARGRYFAETVDYHMEKLLHMDEYAMSCFEQGSRLPGLLVHLAYRAERAPSLSEEQVPVLTEALSQGGLRERMEEKVLLCLYDYYRRCRNTEGLLEILDALDPDTLKRERISEVAAACIHYGLYDKAKRMLLRYGAEDCEEKALAMLVSRWEQETTEEYEPVLAKWSLMLYRRGCYETGPMRCLRRCFMGDLATLTSIYRRCQQMPEVGVDEDINERLLAQVLFVGADQGEYEDIYLAYMEKGENRMLVKAYLSQLAYDYVVERVELSESLFVKIEKEAMYEKDLVMVLAVLRYYRKEKSYAGKQKEFVEWNLERYASDGLILAFMKDYIGNVNVPYEIENTVLIQFYCDTDKGVFLFIQKDDGEFESQQMREVFPGVYVYEMLLFEGEERQCYIYEEERDEKTELMTVRRMEPVQNTAGFFSMVNQMIEAKGKGDKERYDRLRRQYEKDRHTANKLFTVH